METKDTAIAVQGDTQGAVMAQSPRFNFAPKNMTELMEFSKLMAKSTIVPKDFQNKPENVMIAVQMGLEVGLAPMQAIQSIAVINGRPCVWGDAALALVQSSGLLESIEEFDQGKALAEKRGYCRVKRRGDSYPHEVSFTEAQAKGAGLWTKDGPWRNYPGRMLQLRARAFALRDKFPDVLKGLHVREEVEDIEMHQVAADVYMPKRTIPVEDFKPEVVQKVIDVDPSNEVEKTEAATDTAPPARITKNEKSALLALVKHDEGLLSDLKQEMRALGFNGWDEITVDKYEQLLSWAEKKSGIA